MVGYLTFQLFDQRLQFGDEGVFLSANSLLMLPRGALDRGFELRRFKRSLLRLKGLHDLGRQTWKLANIERL
jgi:hypothetical protein